MIQNRLKSFHEMVLSFEDLIVGRDPLFVEELWTTIWLEINLSGHQGGDHFGFIYH